VMNVKMKLIAFGACAIAAGCSMLSPQPDRSKFFILTPISDSAGMTARPASTSPYSRLTLGLGPIDFPEYLRRLPVVTRVSPNRIDLSAEKRWAEPLDRNFERVLSENLAVLLDTQRIEKYPWALRSKVDYEVEVNVQRFETGGDGQAELIAGWIIRDGSSNKILYASQTTAAYSGLNWLRGRTNDRKVTPSVAAAMRCALSRSARKEAAFCPSSRQ